MMRIKRLHDSLEGLNHSLADKVSEQVREIKGKLGDIAGKGAELSTEVRDEVRNYLATSRSVRRDLEHGVRRVKTKLADLDALYEVVHDEVEDTALDLAAGARSVRSGAGMVRRIRRWLVKGRR